MLIKRLLGTRKEEAAYKKQCNNIYNFDTLIERDAKVN